MAILARGDPAGLAAAARLQAKCRTASKPSPAAGTLRDERSGTRALVARMRERGISSRNEILTAPARKQICEDPSATR